MELKNRLQNNRLALVFILFTLFWFSLFMSTGTLSSGYHLRDDHEILSINKNIQEYGFINAAKSIINNDLSIRFRPFYYFTRVVLTKLFGTNYLAWSIYNAVLSILTSIFLFLCVYRQGYRFFFALLFPFLTLIGAQSAIWWRLGPAETTGTFLISFSLFLLAHSIFRQRRYHLMASMFFMFLASLTKESFTLFIPAYVLLLLWFKQKLEPDISVYTLIKTNSLPIIFMISILIVELYIIIFMVGTSNIGYAGIDQSFNIIGFFKSIFRFMKDNYYFYLIVFGVFLILQPLPFKELNFRLSFIRQKSYIFNFLVLLAIIIPQFLIYNKSGIFERYLLPLNLGFSYFIIFLLKDIYEKDQISMFSKRLFTIAIVWVIFVFLKNDTLPNARSFAKEGQNTGAFLSSLINYTQTEDRILVVLNIEENYELGISLNKYLKIEANRENINFFPVESQRHTDFGKYLVADFSNRFNKLIETDISNDYGAIAILQFSNNKSIKDFLDTNKTLNRSNFGYFTVYHKIQ